MEWQAINRARDAIELLRTLEVEVVGIWHSWFLHGVGRDNAHFQLTCDNNAELIEYARSERDLSFEVCEEMGVDSLKDITETDLSATGDASLPSRTDKGRFPSPDEQKQAVKG